MVHLFLEHGVVLDVLVVLEVGVAELAGVGGLPLKNEGLLVHGGDGGIEGFDGLVEYPLHVDVLLGFGEEASVDGEVGGVSLLAEDLVEFLVDRAAHDDRVDRHWGGAGESPDAMYELFVLVVGVGEAWQDEVGAVLEGVSLAHGLESVDEHGGGLGFVKIVEQGKAGNLTDNDLMAVRETLADDLQRGEKILDVHSAPEK